ncbi:hypothetical protein [Kolteria novifilia]|uniref:hypothetical protein n=1 Tax=Kolteria novifilia TaxID=2527975 RepID=UPI003AF4079D
MSRPPFNNSGDYRGIAPLLPPDVQCHSQDDYTYPISFLNDDFCVRQTGIDR